MTNFMINTRISVAAAAALALFTAFPSAAQNTTDPANPPEGWVQVGQPLRLTSTVPGSADIGLGTVPRRNMAMTLDVRLTIYKTSKPVNNQEYYLVEALQSHAVRGYASNWLSLGYYGKQMSLSINGNGAYLYDYGPNSTVGTKDSGWSVGGSIGFEGKSVTGGISGGYSKSYSAPAVTFESSKFNDMLTVKTLLPGDLGDPKEPSRSGHSLYAAAIYQVPVGRGLTITVASAATWQYEYTRLVVNDRVSTSNIGTYYVDFKDKQIVNGTGGCMAVQGNNVVIDPCQTGLTMQQWSVTQQGQLKNLGTGTCMDKDAISNDMVLSSCDLKNTTQQFTVGSGGCSASNLPLCSQTLLPGIYAMSMEPSIAGRPVGVSAPGAGQRVKILDPFANMMYTFWRVQ